MDQEKENPPGQEGAQSSNESGEVVQKTFKLKDWIESHGYGDVEVYEDTPESVTIEVGPGSEFQEGYQVVEVFAPTEKDINNYNNACEAGEKEINYSNYNREKFIIDVKSLKENFVYSDWFNAYLYKEDAVPNEDESDYILESMSTYISDDEHQGYFLNEDLVYVKYMLDFIHPLYAVKDYRSGEYIHINDAVELDPLIYDDDAWALIDDDVVTSPLDDDYYVYADDYDKYADEDDEDDDLDEDEEEEEEDEDD